MSGLWIPPETKASIEEEKKHRCCVHSNPPAPGHEGGPRILSCCRQPCNKLLVCDASVEFEEKTHGWPAPFVVERSSVVLAQIRAKRIRELAKEAQVLADFAEASLRRDSTLPADLEALARIIERAS